MSKALPGWSAWLLAGLALCASPLVLAQDSGFKFYGTVSSLPPAPNFVGDWTVGGRTVRVSAATKIEAEHGPVRTGACVEVKGALQTDGSVRATSIETQEAGRCTSAPAEFKFYGNVQQLPTGGLIGTWLVGGRTVRVSASTRIEQRGGPVAVGSCVEVEGALQTDGSITAREIEVSSGTGGCATAPGERRGPVDFRGVVQAQPTSTASNFWTVSGRRVQITEQTEIHPRGNSPEVGDCVEVQGRTDSAGVVVATRIQGLGKGVCRIGPAEVEDELKLVGTVRTMPASGLAGNWRVDDWDVRVTPDTRLETDHGPFAVGACVEVRGPAQGTAVTATRMQTVESARCAARREARFEFYGTVESMPASGRVGTWKIGGRTVTTTSATVFDTERGLLAVGACVEVEGTLGAGNAMAASRIEVKAASGMCLFRGGVVSAGSYSGFAVSAGQIVSVFGINIGPAFELPMQIEPDDKISSRLANTEVLFDGVAATLLYASHGQLNAVVPCSVAGKTSTVVQIQSNGAWSNTITVPVVPASPSIFTLSDSGRGRGAILNYDPISGYSENSPSNPAPLGSVVSIFATGHGQTTQACVDGRIIPENTPLALLPRAVLPVSVTIGDRPATQIPYAGSAAGLVFGVLQVNVVVPPDVEPGPNVSVVIKVGERSSQPGVTMAVK